MDGSIPSAVSLIAVLLVATYYWTKSDPVPLPPGPKGHPIFGNALEISAAGASWLKFAEYSDTYGPIVSVRILHQRMYILSDHHLATELLEKRASNYSNKGANGMAKLIGWDKDIMFMAFGPTFKRYRTMLSRALNNRVAPDYISVQQEEVRGLMKRLVQSPNSFMEHVHFIAVRITYGHKVETYNDPFVQVAEEHMIGLSELMLPWKWAVNAIPALRHLPLSLPIFPFQRRAKQAKRIFDLHCQEPFKFVQEQMASGTAEDSFTSKLLQPENGQLRDDDTKEHAQCIAATLYGAGSDTTVSAVQSFFLAMTLYPQAQAKKRKRRLPHICRSSLCMTHPVARYPSQTGRTFRIPAPLCGNFFVGIR
ncbi:cytochrome P450 family protein [Ceratobasidium sp. AG-Ba]|nr:cytochrome P450 family protein [Ceratobasidium sp. AG-Ba]